MNIEGTLNLVHVSVSSVDVNSEILERIDSGGYKTDHWKYFSI